MTKELHMVVDDINNIYDLEDLPELDSEMEMRLDEILNEAFGAPPDGKKAVA